MDLSKLSTQEIKQGYAERNGVYTCILCDARFEEGIIYPLDGSLYAAKRAAEVHCKVAHGSMLSHLLSLGKDNTSLTPHQEALIAMFSEGLSDREIVARTEATSSSTIRNQRFALREKYKQAKIFVAIIELMEEARGMQHPEEELLDVHATATMRDERYVITEAEKQEVLGRYLDENNRLKTFPVKQKKKLIILKYLISLFEVNRNYTEKEVNALLGQYYDDTATLRRYMIEYGFLDRRPDGSAYWIKK